MVNIYERIGERLKNRFDNQSEKVEIILKLFRGMTYTFTLSKYVSKSII